MGGASGISQMSTREIMGRERYGCSPYSTLYRVGNDDCFSLLKFRKDGK